jgi:hypothetical protein
MPSGAPGCPELAFWMASMDKARSAPVRGLKDALEEFAHMSSAAGKRQHYTRSTIRRP